YGADHVQYRNRYYQEGNKFYYFGGNGDAMVTIREAIENGKFNIYDMRTNKLIKSLDAGTWENLAYSMDANSINNVDGYLSYSGWYRTIGTSQDGKTWYKTGAGDWRPILMYAWPNKDVQAQFIKYFVGHGYTNEGYGLTPAKVADLSAGTDTKILNEDSQNLRYVIEQSIAKNKSTSKLANDVNAFMQTVPSLSAASELSLTNSSSYVPDFNGTTSNDQLIFVNNNSADQTKGNTSYADSNYRLMNRTLNNQQGNHSVSPELLVGNDIDNSNPVVQAENLNWEYFLLNYGKLMNYNPDGNFDGFRVDAADNVDADVLDQLGQLMNDLYHTKGNQTNANNHLVYNEGYHSDGQSLMDGKGNPALYMDASMFSTLKNVLGRISHRGDITHLATNSVVNRANDDGSKSQTPNWSFVTNHDQRKNLINQMIIKDHPGVKDIMGTGYKAEYANQAWQEFYVDQARAYKQYAQYNVPAQYAILLSNKDTVPQVYYGDLYNETKPYMAEKSMYYDAITTLMKARKEFVSGGQSIERCGQNAVASVRYGKGVADANSIGTDPLSRTTGMAVIVGNNTDMASNTYIINMGKEHANQQYQNLIDTTDAGLTYDGTGSLNPKTLTTDANGNLYVKVKSFANPYVSGYLSVWVPVVAGQQDASTSSSTVASRPDKTFESNAALDSHLIYEDFSLYQPEPTSVNEHAYNFIAKNAQLFNSLGITDFWMAPAYTPFSTSRYNEGYATNDRYTLGTTENPTKYGSGEELANAIAALHKAGLKVQEDLVMNQMIGFSGQEAVTVTRANEYGVQMSVDGKTFANQIYFAYTIGGGEGQKKYGGKYLAELQAKYPDLFTTKALSTGVAPDPTTRITQWSAKYQNGTSLQNIGIGLAVKLPNGDYAYLDGGNNDKFKTTLPEQMGSIDYYVQQELKN
ncbi:glycoside hydrolase family 70 protein, partial [Lactiplantibacillus plantarum]|uniref:glycoside hydrolase family 70 protein n=1 Tax=Lactiplantibacillus plantarum TaxID=1590 RepID=UPI002F269C5E